MKLFSMTAALILIFAGYAICDVAAEDKTAPEKKPTDHGETNGVPNSHGTVLFDESTETFLVECCIGKRTEDGKELRVFSAPKVCIFDGQQCTLSDTCERGFVTDVTWVQAEPQGPVAAQPAVEFLEEGTSAKIRVTRFNDELLKVDATISLSDIGEVHITEVAKDDNHPNDTAAVVCPEHRTYSTCFVSYVKPGHIFTTVFPHEAGDAPATEFQFVVTKDGCKDPEWTRTLQPPTDHADLSPTASATSSKPKTVAEFLKAPR